MHGLPQNWNTNQAANAVKVNRQLDSGLNPGAKAGKHTPARQAPSRSARAKTSPKGLLSFRIFRIPLLPFFP